MRFVAATHAPDGTPLETPGIIHETDAVEIDFMNVELDNKYVWDMEHVLNVWVCPIVNTDEVETEYSILVGFTMLPFFDADEMLEGCNPLSEECMGNGIFLNSIGLTWANSGVTFAHEAGHFFGLDHVFAPNDDYCADTPWYDYKAYTEAAQGYIEHKRTDKTGAEFWSDNIMDYEYGFMTGFTPDQIERMRYSLQNAYFIPGEAGKEKPEARSFGQKRRFVGKKIR